MKAKIKHALYCEGCGKPMRFLRDENGDRTRAECVTRGCQYIGMYDVPTEVDLGSVIGELVETPP